MDGGFWVGRRVFVTGHTGFKGSWLVMLLRELGAEVFGFSGGIPTSPSLFEMARLGRETSSSTVGDVRDLDTVARAMAQARPHVVVHMAAQPLVRRSYHDPIDTYTTNVLGTANVLEAVRHVDGAEVVLVVTSDKVYERSNSRTPHVETDRLGGRDPYSSSKACAELVTRSFRDSFLDPSAPVVVTARAGNVIGGGDWAEDRLVPDIVRAITSSSAFELRNPDAVRPWQHVLDCLSGYLALVASVAERPDLPSAWNIGPDLGATRTVRWLLDSFLECSGHTVDVHTPSEDGAQEAGYLAIDSTQARDLLAWSPRWGIAEAVRTTADWYRRVWDGEDARAVSQRQIELFRDVG